MKRRDFFRDIALISAGTIIIPPALSQCNKYVKSSSLKGFIVSDAHFGWENDQQPEVETQRLMMRKIMSKFPDLNLVIDTGDAHHNGTDRDIDRVNWTENLANQAEGVPFYYVPGNHEITHANHMDTETVCNDLGSMTCRPYYSWDLYGIHFISMPELIRAVYLSTELIEWVKLDLELNKDKTIILLSHNNIIGTTGPFEPGYRGLVNSQEVQQLIEQYPNVVAWMHGHNHNYEIIEENNKLYVSNGRIGGFDPSKGKYGLGGIYFELDPAGLTVKCYSAEYDKFIDEIDGPEFSKVIKFKSSFNSQGIPSLSFGKGCTLNGERIPLFHHHTGNTIHSELFMVPASTNLINEDPDIEYYMERKNPSRIHRQLMGYGVSGGNEAWTFNDPGLKLLKNSSDKKITINAPRDGHGKYTYYRISPGNNYEATLTTVSGEGGQHVKPAIKIWNNYGQLIKEIEGNITILNAGSQIVRLETGQLHIDSVLNIYGNPEDNTMLNMSVEFEFSRLSNDLLVQNVTISVKDTPGQISNPGISYQGKEYLVSKEINQIGFEGIELPTPIAAREVIEIITGSNNLFNLLIRQTGWTWQVRNAAVTLNNNYLFVNGLRNRWTRNKEIIITPGVYLNEPYLQKTSKIESFSFYPFSNSSRLTRVMIHRIDEGGGTMEFNSPMKPSEITGCQNWSYKDGKVHCDVDNEHEVILKY